METPSLTFLVLLHSRLYFVNTTMSYLALTSKREPVGDVDGVISRYFVISGSDDLNS